MKMGKPPTTLFNYMLKINITEKKNTRQKKSQDWVFPSLVATKKKRVLI